MPVRLTMLLTKRPDISHETFSNYWSTHHASIFTPLAVVKKHLIRYNQFHVVPQLSEALVAKGFTISSYDGIAEFWVDTIEDALVLFNDEAFQATMIPDEDNFLDRTAVQFMVGEDQTKYPTV